MFSISTTYRKNQSIRLTKAVFIAACNAVGSPYSASLKDLCLKGQDRKLAEVEIPLADVYFDHESFASDYCLYSLLRKWKGLKTGIDTKAEALVSFRLAEDKCRETNARLRKCEPSIVDPIIHRAQLYVSAVLGTLKRSSLEKFEDWGPGATTDLIRSAAYPDTKLVKLPIPVSSSCLALFKSRIECDLHWSFAILGSFPEGPYSLLKSCFSVTNSSTIDTVPKNATTDRTIAIEPRGNMFLQKGVGGYIRSRLKRFGVDLNRQEVNQEYASKAQALGLGTIDLSMASDTVCTALVRELLPFDWFIYLDSIRCRSYSFRGDENHHWFEKFSSMGNGFTFELESLIFWALTKASQDEGSITSVYGDDIICEQSHAHTVISTLSWAGFTVNDKKSFLSGRFFESCGRHYFDGIDVTPIYQKEVFLDAAGFIRFANRLARYLLRRTGEASEMHPIWRKPYETLLDSISLGPQTPFLPFGSEGDEGILINASRHVPAKTCRNRGYRFQVALARQSSIPGIESAMLALAFRRSIVVELPSYGNIPSRSGESGPCLRMGSRWIEPSWEYYLL